MAIPILEELKNELARIYSAGSGLAKGDPRLQKYMPALRALGQKAPVFNALADKLSALIGGGADSQENLLDLGVMLYSVLYTQSALPSVAEWEDMPFREEDLPNTCLPYTEIVSITEMLKKKTINTNHILILTELFNKGKHNDPRLYKSYCQAITASGTGTSEYIETAIMPSIGEPIMQRLQEECDASTGKRAAKIKKLMETLNSKKTVQEGK
ncbi:MAG: hypothetical protein LBU32_10120 [Clostridiales bacterium]|jgi:hypothetical protein|nr:hypothetical protein [Clostridiales bacterium]